MDTLTLSKPRQNKSTYILCVVEFKIYILLILPLCSLFRYLRNYSVSWCEVNQLETLFGTFFPKIVVSAPPNIILISSNFHFFRNLSQILFLLKLKFFQILINQPQNDKRQLLVRWSKFMSRKIRKLELNRKLAGPHSCLSLLQVLLDEANFQLNFCFIGSQ